MVPLRRLARDTAPTFGQIEPLEPGQRIERMIKQRNVVVLAACVTFVLAGGTAYAGHRVISSSMAGLCGTADLGQLRQVRAKITKNQSARPTENYECEDSSDELFVGAQATQAFDCTRMTRDLERELDSPLQQADKIDEENAAGEGPYINTPDYRIYFFCLGDVVELTELPLSLLR